MKNKSSPSNLGKIIDNGRRIRACLKQPEFSPLSVPAQIAAVLALTAKLFDDVPLDRMTEPEQAVRTAAAAEIPAEVSDRLDTAEKLGDEDRKTIIAMARRALEDFSSAPDFNSNPEQETEEQPTLGAKAEPKPEAQAESKPKSRAAPKE